MKFNALALFVLAAVAGAHAQTTSAAVPTSTAGISPCVLNCVSQAASAAGCSGITDLNCVCTNTNFQQQARSCLESSCSSADVQAAQALQSAECNAASSAISSAASSITAPVASSISSLSSRASSISSQVASISSHASSVSSRIASATNAAGALKADLGAARGGLVGVVMAVLGVVAGAAFVL